MLFEMLSMRCFYPFSCWSFRQPPTLHPFGYLLLNPNQSAVLDLAQLPQEDFAVHTTASLLILRRLGIFNPDLSKSASP